MKKHFFIILLSLIFTASCLVYIPYLEEEELPPGPVVEEYYGEPPLGLDISYFYDYLSPYGIWVYYPRHGYVWIPQDMPYGWRPYTSGHWVWTDYGWTWRSQIVWGWAPFHYGRWGWDRDIGWFWVPDVVWGPAWVTWRSSNLYIGWAPLPPQALFVVGIGIRHIPYSIPYSHWVFVDGNSFLSHSLHRYVFPYERNITIINYTVHQTNIYVRNKRIVNEGIGVERVQKITKKKISRYELRDTKNAEVRRIGPGKLEVYRPKIRKSKVAKPKTVLNKDEAKVRISKPKITIKKPEKRVSPTAKKKSLKEAREREVKLLERSQQREVKELKQKLEKDKKSVRTPAEKKRIEREHKDKVIKLKKTHETEKSQIKARHKKEEEKAKKEEAEKKKKTVKKKVKKKKK